MSRRDEVLEMARTLFSNPDVKALPYDERVEKLEILSNSALTSQVGLTRNDIVGIYEEETGDTGIRNLTKDPRYMILSKADPKTVLALCQSDAAYVELCRNPSTFINLLNVHYPGRTLNTRLSPKENYKRLTVGYILGFFGRINNNFVSEVPITLQEKTFINDATPGFDSSLALLHANGAVLKYDEETKSFIEQTISSGVIVDKLFIISQRVNSLSIGFIDTRGDVWTPSGRNVGEYGKVQNDVGTNVRQVSSGEDFILYLHNDGAVYGTGNNSVHQLGLSEHEAYPGFVKIPIPAKIIQIVSKKRRSLLLDSNGTVWTMGRNPFGLGLHDGRGIEVVDSPIILDLPVKIVQVALGRDHGVLLDENGMVWTFGMRIDEKIIERITGPAIGDPIMIQSLPVKIIQVDAGTDFSIFLDENGDVWMIGTSPRLLASRAIRSLTERYDKPVKVQMNSKIAKIIAGSFSVLLFI